MDISQTAEPEEDESLKDTRPLLSKIRDIWRDMPDEVRAKLPEDGASQIDHYITVYRRDNVESRFCGHFLLGRAHGLTRLAVP